jgi:hypothetical protein
MKWRCWSAIEPATGRACYGIGYAVPKNTELTAMTEPDPRVFVPPEDAEA